MKTKSKYSAIALLTLVAINFAGLKNVYGELVFEEDLDTKEISKKSDSLDDESIAAEESESLDSEESSLDKRVKEKKQISRSERLRRHRMRAELRNEDKLTEKLEELRLKDEMRRLEALNSADKKEEAKKEEALQAQKIAEAKAAEQISAQKVGELSKEEVSNQSVAAVKVEEEKKEDKMQVGLTARGGLSGVLGSNGFEISSRYAAGFTVSVDISDHFGFETGYTRAGYSIAQGNAFGYNPYSYYGGNAGFQNLSMTQNVFEIGPRFNILGRSSKVRPFVAAGVGYYRNSINLDDNTLAFVRMYNPNLAMDYNISGFLGYVGGGAEYKITDNIGITGLFKYYNVFSANQSNPISSAAFVSPNSYSNYGYYGMSPMNANGDSRFQASKTLGKANFYTIQAGLTVSF